MPIVARRKLSRRERALKWTVGYACERLKRELGKMKVSTVAGLSRRTGIPERIVVLLLDKVLDVRL